MEVLSNLKQNRSKISIAIFDFDGTISTLRHGWEDIMKPMMAEMIANTDSPSPELRQEIDDYIESSTGIQTIFQMKWLAETVKKYGINKNASDDPWWYKKEYNRRLMVPVNIRREEIQNGKPAEDFMMKGCVAFLSALRNACVDMYAVSGTDHPDVVSEATVLGVAEFFEEIVGAPVDREDCSKEAVLRRLIKEKKLEGDEIVIIGDGKVEIALAREVNAIALGIASDEIRREGINLTKKIRLVKAGAHAIIGDFQNVKEICTWLGL